MSESTAMAKLRRKKLMAYQRLSSKFAGNSANVVPRANTTTESKSNTILLKLKRVASKLPTRTVEDVLQTAATITRDSVSGVPIAENVCGGVVSVLDHRNRAKDVKKKARLLIERAIHLKEAVDTGTGPSGTCTVRAEAVKSLCHKAHLDLTPLIRSNGGHRFLHLHQYEDLIKDYQAQLDESFQHFSVATIAKLEHDISGLLSTHSSLLTLNTQAQHEISELRLEISLLVASISQDNNSETKKHADFLYTLSISTVSIVLF